MKKKTILLALAIVLFALGSWTARAQLMGAPVKGKVTQEGQTFPNARVTFTNPSNGKTFQLKTDKNGEFALVSIPAGSYEIKVLSDSGEELFKVTTMITGATTTETNDIKINVSKDYKPGEEAASSGGKTTDTAPKLTKEQLAKIKADNDKIAGLNALITQAQQAMQAQNWPGAETALKQLIAAAPDTNRWEFFKALGDAQKNSNELPDAAQTYDQGIKVAQALVSGNVPPDPKNPNSTPAAAKAGMGRILNAQGNVYLKLNKPDEAIASFKRAAEIDPSPAVAYYNLCAVQFNFNKMNDAAAACDKSVAADPSKADAWFFKGSALFKTGKTENGKFAAPPGTAEALSKYLELDANGLHAAEAKLILQKLGQK